MLLLIDSAATLPGADNLTPRLCLLRELHSAYNQQLRRHVMGRILGFVGLLIAMGIGFYLYTKSAQSAVPGGEGSPKATIDINGVKQDLLSIAKAEQGRMASDGKYLPLD